MFFQGISLFSIVKLKKVRAPSPPQQQIPTQPLYAIPNKKSSKGFGENPSNLNKKSTTVFHNEVENIQKEIESLAASAGNDSSKIINVEANVIRDNNTTTDVDDLIESLEKEKECWVLENGKLLPARSPSKQELASSKEDVKVRFYHMGRET